MGSVVAIPASGIYRYQVSYVYERKWRGLRTPNPFEKGQYLVTPEGTWSRIDEIKDNVMVVINQNCVYADRTFENVRRDIKEGYTRQLNKTEMLLYRMLYE